jgi:hypothetical protein
VTRRPSILAALVLSAALGGCAVDNPNLPSLAPRAAERIDPRLPIPNPADTSTPDAALGATLRRLVSAGQGGSTAFDRVMAEAERLAAGAGPARSESWIEAQEALSAAVAARYPVTRALAEIDSLAADRVAARGGISRAEQQQFDEAVAALQPTDRRQAARIRAVQARLGA